MSKFQFQLRQLLHATAWTAASCAAWAMLGRGVDVNPEWDQTISLGLRFLAIAGPLFAIAAWFGVVKRRTLAILWVALAAIAMWYFVGAVVGAATHF
jgi:hypothetical protein